MAIVRQCVVCGKRFEALGSTKTCSLECRRERKRERKRERRRKGNQKVCVVCGAPLIGIRSVKTCSSECRRRRKQQREQEYRQKKRSPKSQLRAMRTCAVCGSPFVGTKTTKTCSNECRRKYEQECAQQFRRQKNAKSTQGKTERTCIVCGASFIGIKTAKTCSDECRRKHKRESNRKKYQQEYLKKVQQRPKKICMVCGTSFMGGKRTLTCSFECRRKYRKRSYSKKAPLGKICIRCGKTFFTKSSQVQQCPDCIKRVYGTDKKRCVVCGKIFDVPRWTTRKTCSKECFRTLKQQNTMKNMYIIPTPQSKLIPIGIRQCPVCGNFFIPARENQKICRSKTCKSVWASYRGTLYKKKIRGEVFDDYSSGTSSPFLSLPPLLGGECPYDLGLVPSDALHLPVL